MPPSLYPQFAEEKQEIAWQTKTSMGTVAPVSPCLWLLLLGGLCLPFWPQVLLPPLSQTAPTALSPALFSPCQVAAEVLPFYSLTPDTLPLWVPVPVSAEVVCLLHLGESALHSPVVQIDLRTDTGLYLFLLIQIHLITYFTFQTVNLNSHWPEYPLFPRNIFQPFSPYLIVI